MILRQRLHLQQLRLGQQSGERIVERMLERVCRRAECHVRTQTMKFARGNRFSTLGPTRAGRQRTRVVALREQCADDSVRIDVGEKLHQKCARERGGRRRVRDRRSRSAAGRSVRELSEVTCVHDLVSP